MTQPVQQMPQIVAGPPGFITISNIVPSVTPTGFSVSFLTDQACEIQMAWWPTQFPNTGPGVTGGPADSSPTTQHSLGVNIGATAAGLNYTFVLQLAAGDSSGLTLRSYTGTVLIMAKYNRTTPALPIRWNMFGGTPPPGAGGSVGPGPANNGPNIGNWSTYAWAQYNPKQTTYPTP